MQIWWRTVKGFTGGGGSDFAILRRLLLSLQHCRTTVRVWCFNSQCMVNDSWPDWITWTSLGHSGTSFIETMMCLSSHHSTFRFFIIYNLIHLNCLFHININEYKNVYTLCFRKKCHCFLWSPYVIGHTIIFLPCDFYLSLFFSSPNLSGRRLDVYHTSTHGVALVRI